MTERVVINYKQIKKLHELYLVEYSPPTEYTKMAIVSLTPRVNLSQDEIAELIEKETLIWTQKFPLTTMTSAFHENGDLIDLSAVRTSNSFVSFFDRDGNLLKSTWETKSTPDNTFYPEGDTKGYFIEQQVINRFDPELEIKKHKRQILILRITAVTWGALIPAIYEISNLVGPKWISILACVYGLYKALRTSLNAWDLLPQSSAAKLKQEIERKKDHYYYHCELNPMGFLKLKGENFDLEEKAKLKKEIDAIASENPE